MKYKIYTTGNWWDEDELLEDYPCLKNYGFEVGTESYERKRKIKDEAGVYIEQVDTVTRTAFYITINSLEELTRLCEELDEPIIIDCEGTAIEIYDSYRE